MAIAYHTPKINLPKCLHGSEIMPIFAASNSTCGMKRAAPSGIFCARTVEVYLY